VAGNSQTIGTKEMGTKRMEIEEYWNKGNIWEQTMNEQTEKRKIKKQTIIFPLNKAVDRLTNQPFIQHMSLPRWY
jgi:hypothetical protein